MVEAVRTTASPFDTWVIVVVMLVLLASWLSAIFLADRSQVRASGQSRPGTIAEPALGHARTGAEGAPETPGEAAREPVGARGRHAREESAPEGETPARADLPAQSTGAHDAPSRPAGRHAMPAQRTGDADRAERSYAGPPPPDEEDETGH